MSDTPEQFVHVLIQEMYSLKAGSFVDFLIVDVFNTHDEAEEVRDDLQAIERKSHGSQPLVSKFYVRIKPVRATR